ncbi:MAG: DNA repair protein RecO [Alphaproteobacteria bacterium]
MLQWSGEALILKVDKFGDHDAIVHLFSGEHGLERGVVKAGMSSKRRADMQPGTLVEARFKARMPEHLGSITFEPRHSFAARVMHDPLRLAGAGSILALLSATLAERDAHPDLYAATIHFLRHVAAGSETLVWLAEYVGSNWPCSKRVGFGLDLTSCVATGATESLAYVSPKSRPRRQPRGGGALPRPAAEAAPRS